MRFGGTVPALATFVALAFPLASYAEQPLIERHGPVSSERPAIMAIHGGSWLSTGPASMRSIEPAVRRWLRRGFSVHSVDHSVGKSAVSDLNHALNRVIEERGASRLCLYGESSGGHLALLLALERREVKCVIAAAAPMDLTRLGPGLSPISNYLFGPEPSDLRRWSPVSRAKMLSASVLLLAGIDDPVVPIQQHRDFVRLRPATDYFFLEAGKRNWLHGTASRRAVRRALLAEARFAREKTRRATTRD